MQDAGETDRRTIITIQGLRAFAYGLGTVVLGSVLAAGGLSAAQAGGVFTAMLAGMALVSFAVGRTGDAAGRRRVYALLFAVMVVTGTVFALTTWLPLLVLAALTGTMSTDPNESGPITTLEQAMLSDAPAARVTGVFARYNAVAYVAGSAGALVAAVPGGLRRIGAGAPADHWWLLAVPVLACACWWLARRLSTAVEPASGYPTAMRRRGLERSRRNVRYLASLFAVDAFGGGLIVQSFVAFWLQRRFGAGIDVLGVVFFATGLLQAASSLAAGWLGARFGLLNTMVFTHIPSNLMLLAIPLAPNLALAVLLLMGRTALSQMDVPARQAYIAMLVDPAERTAAAAYTNTARYVTRPEGPLAAGALMQRVALGAPFAAAGAVKLAYDVVLFATFRGVPLGGSVSAGRPLSRGAPDPAAEEPPGTPGAERSG